MGPDFEVSARIWFEGWTINGAFQDRNGNGVPRDAFLEFKLQDQDRNTIWQLYYEGSQLPAIDHNFTNASALTLSEAETDCDTAWAEFRGLVRCISSPCSQYWDWLTLKCRYDTNEDYHLDKDSDVHHFVRTGQSASGCSGSTGGG
jgi:hypothetical protein